MPLRKIMLIRHAEKPVPELGIAGVDERGTPDRKNLSVRGWQRAGALVRFFAPGRDGFSDPRIERPDALFAASPSLKSLRPARTLVALAQHLALPIRQEFDSGGDEPQLLLAAERDAEVALVSWRQDAMATIARLLLGATMDVPDWDRARFDMVWVFIRAKRDWRLEQVPQLLLPGDRADPIATSTLPVAMRV